ncbi:MAG: bifunctional hydroxymethylpyrimidine kinase/phosphomethylpyrimidine kinase [Methanobacteriaceae archaeon]
MIGITIAGFDPSGGAGVLNDVKTFQSLDIYATAIITALTAQNPDYLIDLEPVSIEFIKKQFDSVLSYYDIKYGKTGMLYSPKIIKTVGKYVDEYDLKLVVDPVMVSSSGGELSCSGIVKELRKHILPNCLIVTPNVYEAEILSGIKISDLDTAVNASIEIGKISNVVITGGHLNGNNIICKKESEKPIILKEQLHDVISTHGTGCCLSSAIAGYTIKGHELNDAIEKATTFVKKAVENNWYGTIKPF